MRKAKTRSSAAADAAGSDVDMDAHSAQEQRGQSPAYDLDLLQPEPPHSPAKARHHLASSGMNGEGAADASYASADPLDVMDEEILFTGDHHDVSRMSDGVLRMSIDLERNGLDPSPGRPIPSATWSIVNNQIEHASEDEDRVPSASPPKREVRPDAKIWQSNE
jgi:hypothetical protein